MRRILLIRLGAMGDIIHALPAAAALGSAPHTHLTWLVEPKWRSLLEGSGAANQLLELNRRDLLPSLRALREKSFHLIIDLQGLIKSALAAFASRSPRRLGYAYPQLREKPAGVFYTQRILTTSPHIVDRHLEIARAAGAPSLPARFPLPDGAPEGDLPSQPFVLANPHAGWISKQWPLQRYAELARLLDAQLRMPLVLNCSPAGAPQLKSIPGVHLHVSSLAGLIHATRRATAVVGVDSGPLHLAAALGLPGVAIFGPTDPARNGPYGQSIAVLRSPTAATTYKRIPETLPCMQNISATRVFELLQSKLAATLPN